MIPNMSKSVAVLGVLLLIILVPPGSFVISAQSDSRKSQDLSTPTETRLHSDGRSEIGSRIKNKGEL